MVSTTLDPCIYRNANVKATETTPARDESHWSRNYSCSCPAIVPKGKRATFIPKSKCNGCPHAKAEGDALPIVQLSGCVHLGEEVRKAACAGCGGAKNVPVHTCAVLGECLTKSSDRTRLTGDEPTLAKQRGCDKCEHQWIPELDRTAIIVAVWGDDPLREAAGQQWWEGLGTYTKLVTVNRLDPTDGQRGLFLKESLYRQAMAQLPEHIEYVTFMDHDLVFSDPHWLAKAVTALKDYKLVQPWEKVRYLKQDGTLEREFRSSASDKSKRGTPGGCWVARRETWDTIGGMPDAVRGGGDRIFVESLQGEWSHGPASAPADWRAYWEAWGEKARQVIGDSWTALPIVVDHIWHGDSRNYSKRYKGMPARDTMQTAENGLPEVVGGVQPVEPVALQHVIAIRSAYTDADLSLRRLDLTRRWCVPSLQAQGGGFSLLVHVDPSDPHLNDRLQLFHSVGVPLHVRSDGGAALDAAYITRMDDDDAIAPDFMRRLSAAVGDDEWYTFPEGFLFEAGQVQPRKYVKNQFATRLCEPGQSPYDTPHTEVTGHVVVDQRPAWVWVRHSDNRSPDKQHIGTYGEPRAVATYLDIFYAAP